MQGFCDGLVEDAITALSRFRWLNVVSRNSSFAQKGRSVDIRRIARDLDVRFVLEGSVRKVGARIRITAQLIDGISGNHIWADHYDREYSAVFDLQDEVVRDIVASLEYALWITLVRGDVGAPNPASSPLRAAGWHLAECTHIGNRTAIACAIRALEANPKSVAAYQYLANAYVVDLITGWTEDEADAGNLLEAARKATSLSPGDHLSQGLCAVGLAFVGNHDEALAYARRALALNSNSINVLGPCGNVLSFCRRGSGSERNARADASTYSRTLFSSRLLVANGAQLALSGRSRARFATGKRGIKAKAGGDLLPHHARQNLGLAWPSRSRQSGNFRRLSVAAGYKQSTRRCHVSASRQVHSWPIGRVAWNELM